MTTRRKWAAAACACLAIAAFFIPSGFRAQALREELREQVERAVGLAAEARGAVRMAFLPWPRATFLDVRIGSDGDPARIITQKLRADLSLARLLSGELAFSRVVLLNPTVDIEEIPTGQPLGAARGSRADIGSPHPVVEISKGALKLHVGGGKRVALQDVNARLNWSAAGGPATLTGACVWRGERFKIEALLSRPADLAAGERSPFTIRASSGRADLSLNGSVTGGARWLVDGRLAFTSERFATLLDALDLGAEAGLRPSRLGLTGQFRALPHSATLSEMRLSTDGGVFEGALALRTGGERPIVSGTLATRSFELKAVRTATSPIQRRNRQWSQTPLQLGSLDLVDADLRVSANRLIVGQTTVTDAGFLLAISNGRLTFTTASADVYGGVLRGRVTIDARAAQPVAEIEGSLRNVNLSQASRALVESNRVSGAADVEMTAQTVGPSVNAMMQQLAGSVKVAARNLEIVGVDLERAVRRSEKRPLSIPVEMRTGQTSFRTAEMEGAIQNGVLRIERALARSPGLETAVGGSINIAERTLRLEVSAAQPRSASVAAAAGKDPSTLVVDLVGSWEDPYLLIDPEALISRSEAAAPLTRRPTPASRETTATSSE